MKITEDDSKNFDLGNGKNRVAIKKTKKIIKVMFWGRAL
jgi:hypothetical protein